MLTPETINELRGRWLPHVSDSGLNRVIQLLESNSRLLVHGCFSKAVPMGCLATQIAWHHPETEHLTADAGVRWLSHVAGLNPATSHVIRSWDACGPHSWEARAELLGVFRAERRSRQARRTPAGEHLVAAEL